MLGYDANSASVIFTRTDGSENDGPPKLYRLRLEDPRPRTAVRIGELREEGDAPDPNRALLERLLPLVRLSDAEVVMHAERPCRGCRPRAHLSGEHVSSRTVTILGPPVRARVLSVWRVPGRGLALAVISYLGVQIEGGYDRHEPVLLGYRPARVSAGRRPVRLRLEMYGAGVTQEPRLVLVGPDGPTRDVQLGVVPGPCRPEADAAEFVCADQRLAIRHRGREAWVEREGRRIAQLMLPAGTRVNAITYARAHDEGASEPFEALCADDHDCRIQANGRRRAFFPEPGSIECTWTEGWQACLYSDATPSHHQRAVWLRLRDAGVEELPLGTSEGQRVTHLSNAGPGFRVEVDGREREGLLHPPNP